MCGMSSSKPSRIVLSFLPHIPWKKVAPDHREYRTYTLNPKSKSSASALDP